MKKHQVQVGWATATRNPERWVLHPLDKRPLEARPVYVEA